MVHFDRKIHFALNLEKNGVTEEGTIKAQIRRGIVGMTDTMPKLPWIPEREVCFAVVIYGAVSMAIYILATPPRRLGFYNMIHRPSLRAIQK
jgi:hypothetical protein